jgi:hypothetical protein
MKKRNRGAGPDVGPAREIVRQSSHLQVGEIYQKGITTYPAAWESFNERRVIFLLLMCRDVSAIEVQPTEIEYELDGKARKYVPDIRIRHTAGRALLEVKSLRYLITPPNLEKYTAIAQTLRGRGEEMAFIAPAHIPSMWHDNAFLLARYRSRPVSSDQRILDLLTETSLSIDDILQRLPDVSIADVYALIARKQLCIDWDKPLNRQAQVSCPGKPFEWMRYERLRDSGRYADVLAAMALGRRPSDQRLLAASFARRRPLSPSSPVGFVEGIASTTLAHLKRQKSKHAPKPTDVATDDPGQGDGTTVANGGRA